MSAPQKTIWTIGHSTHPMDEFVAMLNSFDICLLADIRRFPGSKKYPHFNKETLSTALPAHGIAYRHLEELGGRRKARPDSENTALRHPAFRGYADYMETDEFKTAVGALEELALEQRSVMMCSEAVWWRCHRSLVSDYLKVRGWNVMHIMSVGRSTEHPFTSAAQLANGTLSYKGLGL